MDCRKRKEKKNMMAEAWKRCQSITRKSTVAPLFSPSTSFSKSSPANSPQPEELKVTPKGYFPVYVGADKQRFLIKTRFANHPLFQMLLEEAELEYGYHNEGPLLLPCHSDSFYEVLEEIINDGDDEISPRCGFGFFTSSHHRGYNNDNLLTPSPGIKLNS